MIRIEVNNGRMIEISKPTVRGSLLNVDVIDSNGELDYYYVISEGDLVMMLNEFQRKNNIS